MLMITDVFLDQKRVKDSTTFAKPSHSTVFIVCSHTRQYHICKAITQRCLYRVFTYIYSLLIEIDICDPQNVSVQLPCVYTCFSSRDLFTFSVRHSSLFSYFYVMCTSALSFPRGLKVLTYSLEPLLPHSLEGL